MKTMTTTSNATGTKVMNKQGILGKMKVLVLALLATMTLGFASCSSDDDSNGPAQPTAAKVENVQLHLEVSENSDMLDVNQYVIQWYDADGNLQEKTLTHEDSELKLNFTYKPTAKNFGCKVMAKEQKFEKYRLYNVVQSLDARLTATVNGEFKQIVNTGGRTFNNDPGTTFENSSKFAAFRYKRKLEMEGTAFYKLTQNGVERVYSSGN